MAQPILPHQVVNYLDEQYPQAKNQLVEKGDQFYLERAHAPKARQILSMIENIPPELLNFDNNSNTEFGEAISAIQCAIDAWNAGDNQYKLQKIPGRQKMHPFTVIRKHLVKLKDEEAGIMGDKEKMVDINKATPDRRKVFVVHGRDNQLRSNFFNFLRALGLQPIEWSEALKLTRKASPYIGEAIEIAFNNAQAVIVLLSPDDEVRLSPQLWKDEDEDNEKQIKLQARPNVLFEAGMAFGTHADRTILVEIGKVKAFSDVAGRHIVRLSNSPKSRNDIAERLKIAGCDVSTSGNDWLNTGTFEVIREIIDKPIDYGQTDLSEGDILALLDNWWPKSEESVPNNVTVNFREVDQLLSLPYGSTKKYIFQVASRKDFKLVSSGNVVATFEYDVTSDHFGTYIEP